MSRRSLVLQSPNSITAFSGGSAPSARDRWISFAHRHWPVVLPGRPAFGSHNVTRLMAAVYTDMAGYSRLFALDDTGTVARLQALHRELIEPAINDHHGRLVQTGGDSMLIIFESVAQAVKCAVAIQQELAIDSANWPGDRGMRLRIGVDLGDIIMDGMNFHGDGVITAARLQAVCPPGGVCVSRAVHERGGERLGLPFEALGPLVLKNVARPVEAFVLWPPGENGRMVT
jgi:class 3 adenylate cyclase